MHVKDAQNLIKNALRKSANSPYTPDEPIASEFANNRTKPQNHSDTPEDKKLKELCLTLTIERYGLNVPVEVINRLEQELEVITQNGRSRAYLLAYEVAKKCKQLCAPHIARGAAGSSLAAFILGITHTDPLPFHLYCLACGSADFEIDKYYDGNGGENALYHCGYDLVKTTCPRCGDEFEGDGHNIPFEIFADLNGEKAPCFEIDVPEELCDEINGFLRGLLNEEELKQPERNCCVHVFGDPILSLFNKLQEQTLVSEDCISVDGVDLYEAFSKGGYKDIPLLENIPGKIIDGWSPSCFSDIVKLLGLINGTANTGKAEEYISDLGKTDHLFPRAHDTEFAIKLYKLMWYRQNFPEEYEHAINEYRDALESNKSKKGE